MSHALPLAKSPSLRVSLGRPSLLPGEEHRGSPSALSQGTPAASEETNPSQQPGFRVDPLAGCQFNTFSEECPSLPSSCTGCEASWRRPGLGTVAVWWCRGPAAPPACSSAHFSL